MTATPDLTDLDQVTDLIAELKSLVATAATDDEARTVTSRIAQITRAYRIAHNIGVPLTPVAQAIEVDKKFRTRAHLDYLSRRVAEATRDVERGQNRLLAVSMPPRAGKSTLLSQYTPLWLLRRHPDWKIISASHDHTLSGAWARYVRRVIEDRPDLGIAISPDHGAGYRWETVEAGGIYTTSVRGSITGRGARVLLIDDPVKDFVDSHSQVMRQNLWDWWLSTAQTRLEPPYLVIVVMTRWHEDDFIGRLMSQEYEGDPKDWEYIRLPAIATADDVLGRAEGEPLISPLLDETPTEAVDRWDGVRRAVGTYTFSSMYQQRPAPAKGAIFDSGWWRFWTTDPDRETEDGRVVYLDPSTLTGGTWTDSWDCNFRSSAAETGGYVVGQRWVRMGSRRYLVAQQRGRWSFTQTLAAMKKWARADDSIASPWGHLVHSRLIEERANGAAIIDVMKEEVSGIKPVNPTVSKEARARAVTPEIESGDVFLPHPSDPGNDWVADLLSELRNFPYDAHDDQVDTLTQALSGLRTPGRGAVTVPGRNTTGRPRTTYGASRDIARAAMTDNRRRAGH